ncbi:hypothetical protein BO1005MUT1_70350 [Hyphomicrobiales bacterium]|nr:hypothetical protein BO1005MUT1_70350 [Hyphomicrobiales bacterium]
MSRTRSRWTCRQSLSACEGLISKGMKARFPIVTDPYHYPVAAAPQSPLPISLNRAGRTA